MRAIEQKFIISYINIIKKWGSKNDPTRWWIYFAIPFQTSESKKDYIEVKSIRKKTLPIFGKVVSVAWQYNDKAKILGNKFINSPEIFNFDFGEIFLSPDHPTDRREAIIPILYFSSEIL